MSTTLAGSLHFRQEIMTVVQVVLRQADPHREGCVSGQPFAFAEFAGQMVTTFVKSVGIWGRNGENAGSDCSQEQDRELHLDTAQRSQVQLVFGMDEVVCRGMPGLNSLLVRLQLCDQPEEAGAYAHAAYFANLTMTE